MKLAWILWLSQLLPQPAADSLCLSTTVYLEARDQTLRGQQAVAAQACPTQEARSKEGGCLASQSFARSPSMIHGRSA